MFAETLPERLLPDTGLQGLTSKQYHFATYIFQGLTYTDAYRKAYGQEGMTDQRLSQKASEVANHPKIQAKLAELRHAAEEKSSLLADLGREWILQELMYIARNGEKESNRLRALEDLGKVAGIDLFRETTRVEKVTRTPEDLDRELQERLAEMAKTIEGKASTVEPAAPAGRDRRRKPAAG